MSPGTLLRHFEKISEAPDAVTRLRQFVFSLAIRGKLVPKDPADEPVATLLNQIRKAREALQNGNGRAQKNQQLGSTSPPFEVPRHWALVPINQIGAFGGGMTPSMDHAEFWGGNIDWFSPKDIKADELLSSELRVTSEAVAETRLQVYPPGCLLMVARSGILKRAFPVAINRVEATVNQDIKVLKPFVAGLERFLQVALKGITGFVLSALVKTGTTVQSFKYDEFQRLLIPLPPFSEQRRIVAKIGELMALGDELEAAKRNREQRRERLVTATLHGLSNGVDDGRQRLSFQESARLCCDNLPRLITRPEHIQHFRQAVLSLAVQGKLVPQRASDGSVDALLTKISAVKGHLIESGRLPKQKKLPAITKLDVPFACPSTWRWVRLSDVAEVQDPNPSHRMPRYVTTEGVPFVSSENFVNGDGIDFTVGKRVSGETLQEQISRFSIAEHALAFSRIGTIGKSRFLPLQRTYCLSHALCVINPLDPMLLDMRYIRICLGADTILAFAVKGTRSIGVPDLGMAVIRGMLLPLPPIPEQARIVTKVNELTTLCGELESQLNNTVNNRRSLLEATLRQAMGAISAGAAVAF